MPSEGVVKSVIYHRLKKDDFKYTRYYCNVVSYNSNNCKDGIEYICAFGTDTFYVSGTESSTIVNNSIGDLTWCDGVYKGQFAKSNRVKISKDAFTNSYFNSNFNSNIIYYSKDILLDSPFYQELKFNQLNETIISSNNDSSSSTIDINLNDTNNILFSILLSICVLILYLVLRKIFFRSV